jgi:putative glutathione S-transferase
MRFLSLMLCWLLLVPLVKAFVRHGEVRASRSALHIDKGFNILETASKVVPQGQIVYAAKETWKFAWKRMMAELAPQDKSGSYQRPSYTFEGRIGSSLKHPDEPGRYQVYLGNPCPWCHRVRLVLALRDVSPQEVGVTMLVDDPIKASRGGWCFSPNDPDPVQNCRDLRELYDLLSPAYKGRCTAPLLVDTKARSIVSNESSDIVRQLNEATFQSDKPRRDLYPKELQKEIDETNDWVYNFLSNGCYQCGFSTTQAAYNEAAAKVRLGLEKCEALLSKQDYLCGSSFTEADLRLLPTALRFDGVYAPLFKASQLRIRDYPNLHAWLKRCWSMDGVPGTIDLEDANASYYKQLFPLNPGGIIPSPVTTATLGLE